MDIEELEDLSMWAKTPEQKNKLMEIYLNKKRDLENDEFHKQLSKCRKKYEHKIFVTPHFSEVVK